jgi:N-acetylmuramate 1-kinase
MACGANTIESWAGEAAGQLWPGARVDKIAALRGDASARRFWRLWIASSGRADAPETAILVDLGPHDLPLYVRELNLLPDAPAEMPWINVHRFLTSIGAPVPALYECSSANRAMLIEDVGDLSLSEAVRRPGADVADLFRLAVEELLRFHVDGTRRIDRNCIARSIEYNGRLFEWEMKEFVEFGLAVAVPGANSAAIRPELARLAARLDNFPRVFSHRDYFGQNLFIQAHAGRDWRNEPQLRIIDFQDALMAPDAQDLAVLMTTRDTGEIVTPAIERRLLDFYYAGLARRGAASLGVEDLLASYRLCVLQHALKMIGRFEAFERGGKAGYRRYIPHAIGQARRMLAEIGGEFPKLRGVLAE